MKTPPRILIVLLFSFFAWNCSASDTQNLEQSASESAQEVIELTDEFFQATHRSIFDYRHKADHLNILTSGRAFPKDYLDIENSDIQVQTEKTQKLLSAATNLYNAYYKIAALGMNKDEAGLQTAARACMKHIRKFDETETDKEESAKQEEITDAYQISANELMYGLNERLTRILTDELQDIRTFADEYYKKYSEGLKKVPIHKFDTFKVEQMVDEPYRDKQVLIKLYKLQMDEEVQAKTTVLASRAKFIESLLKELNLLHAEMIKRNRSKEAVEERIMKINELSGQN